MNIAIILSGGTGTRMRSDGFPKQYVLVKDKPIIIYTLEKFQHTNSINSIVVVAAKTWEKQLLSWIEQYCITKVNVIAPAGNSRQESILNGLETCAERQISDDDRVIIHDAVRPMVSESLIDSCIESLDDYDGCMPVLHVNDTVYQSKDGIHISSLLDRDTLYAGQAPESFRLNKYLRINRVLSKSELNSIRGSSESAYKKGLNIRLIPGDDRNIKLTTPADLERFETIVEKGM